MALVDYSASSESEVNEEDEVKINSSLKQRCLLPPAKNLLSRLNVQTQEKEEEVLDDPNRHEGRLRSFKHERGNWATYVYIPLSVELFDELQDHCIEQFKDNIDFKKLSSIHISLSKTIVLPYHQIEPFVGCLEQALKVIKRFRIYLTHLNVLSNDENTRTFLTACVNKEHCIVDELSILGDRINAVMNNFQLPTFYEESLFHASFLWCLDDKRCEIKSRLKDLYTSLPLNIEIDTVCCKSGYKQFSFSL